MKRLTVDFHESQADSDGREDSGYDYPKPKLEYKEKQERRNGGAGDKKELF